MLLAESAGMAVVANVAARCSADTTLARLTAVRCGQFAVGLALAVGLMPAAEMAAVFLGVRVVAVAIACSALLTPRCMVAALAQFPAMP